jgi:hypothetical protein
LRICDISARLPDAEGLPRQALPASDRDREFPGSRGKSRWCVIGSANNLITFTILDAAPAAAAGARERVWNRIELPLQRRGCHVEAND